MGTPDTRHVCMNPKFVTDVVIGRPNSAYFTRDLDSMCGKNGKAWEPKPPEPIKPPPFKFTTFDIKLFIDTVRDRFNRWILKSNKE
jgi:hypothetical protein